tara:strand:+ start:154 stop:465 length:312 start_codon:yes stop_codon:yes gene_type:complete
MTDDDFFNIKLETPPPELELSVEMRCREVMNSDDFEDVKKYCIHLIRYQMKQDVFLAGMLGRLAELEALNVMREMKKEKLIKKKYKTKKTLLDRFQTMLSVFR